MPWRSETSSGHPVDAGRGAFLATTEDFDTGAGRTGGCGRAGGWRATGVSIATAGRGTAQDAGDRAVVQVAQLGGLEANPAFIGEVAQGDAQGADILGEAELLGLERRDLQRCGLGDIGLGLAGIGILADATRSV